MAYIKNIPIHATVKKAIYYACDVNKNLLNEAINTDGVKKGLEYIQAGKKTRNGELISCNFGDWRNADVLFEKTRKQYGKNDKILAHHFPQSFDPAHNITPEEAHRIGVEVAERQFGKLGFDYIVTTHVDKKHIHNHIIVNNVARRGSYKGRKYYHNKNTYRYLRKLNIEVCRDFGIPAVDCRKCDEEYLKLHPKSREDSEGEIPIDLGNFYRNTSYIKQKAYDSWSEKQTNNIQKIRADINEQITKSTSWEDFVLHGWHIVFHFQKLKR